MDAAMPGYRPGIIVGINKCRYGYNSTTGWNTGRISCNIEVLKMVPGLFQ